MVQHKKVLYTMDGCFKCFKIRTYLEKNNILFKEVNISKHPDQATEVIALIGQFHVPVFQFGKITLYTDIINKIESGMIDMKGD